MIDQRARRQTGLAVVGITFVALVVVVLANRANLTAAGLPSPTAATSVGDKSGMSPTPAETKTPEPTTTPSPSPSPSPSPTLAPTPEPTLQPTAPPTPKPQTPAPTPIPTPAGIACPLEPYGWAVYVQPEVVAGQTMKIDVTGLPQGQKLTLVVDYADATHVVIGDSYASAPGAGGWTHTAWTWTVPAGTAKGMARGSWTGTCVGNRSLDGYGDFEVK
jgi:hypothetical protein